MTFCNILLGSMDVIWLLHFFNSGSSGETPSAIPSSRNHSKLIFGNQFTNFFCLPDSATTHRQRQQNEPVCCLCKTIHIHIHKRGWMMVERKWNRGMTNDGFHSTVMSQPQSQQDSQLESQSQDSQLSQVTKCYTITVVLPRRH